MNSPILLISAIFAASLVCAILPRIVRSGFALIVSAWALFVSYNIFRLKNASWDVLGYTGIFRMDGLAAFILLFIALFGFLIILYSTGFLKGVSNVSGLYYSYILATIAGSIGAILSNNLLVFIGFWGFLGITLYLLISVGGDKTKAAAKKTFIIIGGSDALMLLGVAIIWKMAGTINMDLVKMPLTSHLAVYAFILLALGAFAKAGAIPMHTWIPDAAEATPLPVMAFLPASLDKLLGIYFLARLSLDMFVIQPNSAMSTFLLIIGSVTIIAAVMMALIQHTMRRLLAYHAVSQVGYMVLGLGTANPIGIAGGLFHMLNHAIYKSTLFLTAGAVEKEAGTTDLDKLGGLARFMPISFVCCLIASLAISGVPPFNGFVSKWMIYQGIIEMGSAQNKIWVLWLSAAMFGSALTLASFMKLLHAVFLGQSSVRRKVKEVPVSMWLPMSILAALCVIFGIFAFQIPLKYFIIPAVNADISYIGLWQPREATLFIIIGLGIGFLIYLMGNIKNVRTVEPFIGGETLPGDTRPTGTEFYNTITDIPLLGKICAMAKEGLFDVYEIGKKLTFGLSGFLQHLHNGVLPTYLAWCLVGMLIVFIVLLRLLIW
ncbi:MAG: proton-conducting transporter membrane subunit [Candidatus Omnitrophota bacterium]